MHTNGSAGWTMNFSRSSYNDLMTFQHFVLVGFFYWGPPLLRPKAFDFFEGWILLFLVVVRYFR